MIGVEVHLAGHRHSRGDQPARIDDRHLDIRCGPGPQRIYDPRQSFEVLVGDDAGARRFVIETVIPPWLWQALEERDAAVNVRDGINWP